jgi:hypothetical protein
MDMQHINQLGHRVTFVRASGEAILVHNDIVNMKSDLFLQCISVCFFRDFGEAIAGTQRIVNINPLFIF